MNCLPFEMQVHPPDDDRYYPRNKVPEGANNQPTQVLKTAS